MFGRNLTAVLSLFPVLLLGASVRAADDAPVSLVLAEQGTLPIILTVPHGGRQRIPGVEERDVRAKAGGRSKIWGGYVKSVDADTDILARRIAAEITRITGKSPYLVMAKFSRKYIDANRPPEMAFDDPAARPYYDYYHSSVRRFIDEIRGKYQAGLLIDVHGQSMNPAVVMRGTRNGSSVAQLLKRAGFPAVTGPDGIFGQLEANGFKVFPGNDVPTRGTFENAGLNGGYTVAIYGSDKADGIDSVQMEFGSKYRQHSALDQSGENAGRAIAHFYRAYLREARR
ncbi:MAG TPA: hypothetical protein VMI15_06010 [Burkholderiales bacterium]|nr:hypothetical protein [Burkholderiales bacterium]